MQNQLTIVIDYEQPPRVEDIGALFSALARDYKSFSRGRVLVVASIEHGSIIATLVDWALQAIPYAKGSVEIAKGAKALADFGKLLIDGIKARKSASMKLPQPSAVKRSVQRSVNSVVKTAAENGCSIRVKHTSPDGETFEVEMTSPQAVEAQVMVLEAKETSRPPTAISDETRVLGVRSASQAIGRLYAPETSAYSPTQTQTMVDSLYDVLKEVGLTHLIPLLAADLSHKGLHAIAAALQAKVSGDAAGKLA